MRCWAEHVERSCRFGRSVAERLLVQILSRGRWKTGRCGDGPRCRRGACLTAILSAGSAGPRIQWHPVRRQLSVSGRTPTPIGKSPWNTTQSTAPSPRCCGTWIVSPVRPVLDALDPFAVTNCWAASPWGSRTHRCLACLAAVPSRSADDANFPAVQVEWDAGDMGCGDLVMALRWQLKALPPRGVIRVTARDPAAPEDLPAWCRLTGHRLLTADHPFYVIQRKD